MPSVVEDLVHLPLGSHCIAMHVSREEAADHAVALLSGSPEGAAASFWVSDPALASYYTERLAETAPSQVGCVHVLDHEQVERVSGRLRPTREVRDFVQAHPEGVTGGADTITRYWAPENIPDHLEYEAWFDEQPRDQSRFLCPYDLRGVLPTMAPRVLRELGRHHSHVILSSSTEPAVRLLQLFIFARPADLPAQLADTYRWATEHDLLHSGPPGEEMRLAPAGEAVVEAWASLTRVDW